MIVAAMQIVNSILNMQDYPGVHSGSFTSQSLHTFLSLQLTSASRKQALMSPASSLTVSKASPERAPVAQVIELLKKNSGLFETAMFYVSDHGESLGEGGVYLHGLPKAIAPLAQLHVPAIMWIGDSFDEIDVPALRKKSGASFTHDNLFHTALGFLEVETSIYRPDLDILTGVRRLERK